jgi:tetratricopeptide (TPR) repeat protein
MNWLALLKSMEELYRWKRENHPPYPDLRLEEGLYHHLRGALALEAAVDGRERAAAEELMAAGNETLKELGEEGSVFSDFLAWEKWALSHRPAMGDPDVAPGAEALRNHFRSVAELRSDTLLDRLIEKLEPLDEQPEPVRRAVCCSAFHRLFTNMAEFHATRAGVEAVSELHTWAVLAEGNLSRYWLYSARYERQHGDPDRVEAELAKGLAIYPDEIELMRELAVEKERQELTGDAIKLLERAVELKPGWPDLRLDLARLLEHSEHPESSLVHLGKALELNPGYEEAAISRAEVLVRLGEWDEAETNLLDLKDRKGESQAIYSMLSRIYAERNDRAKAARFGMLAQESEDS